MKKYKVGTQLRCLQENSPYFKKGETYLITESPESYDEIYSFSQIRGLPNGWNANYIENPKQFKPSKITNWKEIIDYKV